MFITQLVAMYQQLTASRQEPCNDHGIPSHKSSKPSSDDVCSSRESDSSTSTSELCDRMKTLEERFEAKSAEHSMLIAKCEEHHSLCIRNFDSIRSSAGRDFNMLDQNANELHKQMVTLEARLTAKNAEHETKL